MDIAATFRGDRFRLVSGSAWKTPENAAEFRHKSCPAWKKRRAASPRPAIIARPCNDRVATQDPEQMDITAMLRSDRCRVVFPKSSKFPGNSSKRSRTRKKFAGWDPSRAKSPAKQRFSAFKTGQRCTHLGPIWGQNDGNWSQDRVSGCGWCGNCRQLEVPFQGGPKATRLPPTFRLLTRPFGPAVFRSPVRSSAVRITPIPHAPGAPPCAVS